MAKVDISVRELVDKVQRGELALPEMQRRYVWPATRVRDLLDSLYRGYPSGTILVWETDEEIEIKEMAVKSTKAPISAGRLLLLDGQQRVTSLAAIISGEPVHVRRRRRPIEILFNLEHPEGPPAEVLEVDEDDSQEVAEELDEDGSERDIQEELRRRTFVVASRALQANPIWVPVTNIFTKTDKELLKPLKISSEDERWDKYSDRLQKVRTIASYQYVMQVLEKRMSYEEVTEIFVRVNSLGIKLRGTDLALAQISSRWKGFMALCEDFASEFADDENFLLDSGLLVRVLVVFATHQSRFKTVGRLTRKNLQDAWSRAKEGIRFAINFARSNASIETMSLLSSPLLLVPIAVYSDLRNYELSPREEKGLLRWFFLAHMRGHYSLGSSESILDGDLSLLFRNENFPVLLKQLEQHVKQFAVREDELVNRGVRNPLFTMLYFVLRQNGAKDWLSGLKLSDRHVGRNHKLEYHHIFPKSLLLKKEYEKKQINEIANMAFIGGKANRHILNKPPSEYFPNEVIPKRGEAALSSQLIPLNKTLWNLQDYSEFLSYRRKEIAKTINSFMSQFE